MKYIELIFPDIICYTIIAILAIIALFLKETIGKTCCNNPFGITAITIFLLITLDLFVPLYHSPDALLRPAYTTQIIITCYVFLPISDNLQAVIFGTAVTICHLVTLGFITYRKTSSNEIWFRLGSDAIYMLCINGMGLYFRFMNEILKRRTFLDRRACVQSTLHLKHEEDQEEQLMLSILPQHIAKKVRENLKSTLNSLEHQSQSLPEIKPFRELYIEPHDNVTILYADIVRYTEMTKKLPVMKLVETLNELFGKFDDASEDHDVLRIKFLGDCYYCVSGIPVSNSNHATNCVELGLDMINIIQEVRRKRNLNIDMRIGVHSGSIYGGIIGECKWQYDIWSEDVDIANRMEQSGQPGKVHITHHTLEKLNGKYAYTESDASEKDEYLKKLEIKTYLIAPNTQEPRDEIYNRPSITPFRASTTTMYNRRQSASTNRNYTSSSALRQSSVSTGMMSHRRTAFMSHNIKRYQLGLIEIENKLEEAIRDLPLRKFEQWFRSPIVNPFFLTFRNWKLEFPYFLLPDPLFKYYLLSSLGILIAILAIQYLTWFQLDISVYLTFAIIALFLLILIPLTWTYTLLKKFNLNKGWNFFEKISEKITHSTTFRTCIYIVASCLIAACTVLDLNDETWNRELKPQIACMMSVTFLAFTLHLIDRQAEYLNRLDFEWKNKLSKEQKEAQSMHKINTLLLQNILPVHVAYHYLDINRPVDELYHEHYKSVAVMFASVVDFELNKEDIETDLSASTITIMNTVISEFDKLLVDDKKIEKIKVVGWTYMAACGLDPGRKDSTTSVYRPPANNIVIQLVRFGVKMMQKLKEISEEFSQFKLRIGISHGEVTAGVVGSKKPLYDIWGDAVNMASRMDSTGEKGRIQVTKNTADILKKQGIKCIYRGQTKIKSLDHTIPTFFVDLDSENLQLIENNITR